MRSRMVIAAQPGIFYRSKQSQYNMNLLLAADPTKFFGTNHIILLCISVVLIIGLSIVIAKTNIKFSTILNIMLVIWALSELIK